MSRLKALIEELCPHGVEYKRLEEVALLKRGKTITQKDTVKGDVPVLSGGQAPAYYHNESNCTGDTIVVAGSGAYAGYVSWWDIPIFVSDAFYIKVNGDFLNERYCFHWLKSKQYLVYHLQKGSGVPHVYPSDVGLMEIPVPPLEVQREIVRILDSFTELTAELTVELTAELTARKTQYEYYRDELLKIDYRVNQVKLDDILKIKNGADYKKHKRGNIPVYGSGGIMTYIDTYAYNKPSVLIPRKGSLENLFYVEGPFWTVDTCFYTVINEEKASPKYVYYCLSSMHLEQFNTGAGVPSLTQAVLKNIRIPLPEIEKQNKLVYVLDNFESICSDLNIGLPAEIEARKKQYEYYREALLTYAATGEIIAHRQTDRQTDRQAIIKLIQYVFGSVNVKLSDIAVIARGGNFGKKDFKNEGIPCVHYGQIYTEYGIQIDKTISYISEETVKKAYMAEKDDIIMAVTSENLEDICKCLVWLGDEKVAVGGHTAIIRTSQNAMYLAYYFYTTMFFRQKRRLAHGTKVLDVTPSTLGEITIPLPTLEKQEKIVEILDSFNTLVHDMSEGIPAEIEARRKQYEYYRDQLLSF